MCTPREQWAAYESANAHECKLLFDRINALLNSQAVLVAATVFMYGALFPQNSAQAKLISTAVGSIGIASALVALIAILLGCRVLRHWHYQAAELIKDYGETHLKGCYLKSRGPLPDMTHWLTIEVYGGILPVIFISFWTLAICWMQGVFG